MKYKITITDETVEIAAIKLYQWNRTKVGGIAPTWDNQSDETRQRYRDHVRVALNAAAPHVGVEKVTR